MQADDFQDITDVVCPINFFKVKVVLEELDDGQILKVRLNERVIWGVLSKSE